MDGKSNLKRKRDDDEIREIKERQDYAYMNKREIEREERLANAGNKKAKAVRD